MNKKFARILSVLMVMTMISTCAISGTFAKYVTGAEGGDAARVAKWGIVLTMDGDLFAKQYETDDDEAEMTYSVVSSNEDRLVAPGTSGDAFRATVKGTPEVATRYTLQIPAGWTDVVLPAGEYTDYTMLTKDDATGEYGYNSTFTLPADYSPVKWDIAVTKGNTTIKLSEVAASSQHFQDLAAAMGGTPNGFSAKDAVVICQRYSAQLEALLESMVTGASNAKVEVDDEGNINLSMDFEANKVMDFEFALTWTWDFDDNGAGTFDKADTYLGNIAAGICELPQGGSVNIAATFKAAATQID